MSLPSPDGSIERSLCGACERRKSVSAPRGTANKLARDIGATVTTCMDICNTDSIPAGVDGINYTYRSSNAPDQTGSIVTDQKGEVLPVIERYKPDRFSAEYSVTGDVEGVEVQVNVTYE